MGCSSNDIASATWSFGLTSWLRYMQRKPHAPQPLQQGIVQSLARTTRKRVPPLADTLNLLVLCTPKMCASTVLQTMCPASLVCFIVLSVLRGLDHSKLVQIAHYIADLSIAHWRVQRQVARMVSMPAADAIFLCKSCNAAWSKQNPWVGSWCRLALGGLAQSRNCPCHWPDEQWPDEHAQAVHAAKELKLAVTAVAQVRCGTGASEAAWQLALSSSLQRS